MRVTFDASHLEKILKDVTRIIPATATNMHKFVRITADKAECRVDFLTTSTHVSIRRTIYDSLVQSPVTIDESGVCLLPARELVEVVKRASDKVQLSHTLAETQVTVKFGKAEFKLYGLDPTEFKPYQNDPEKTARIGITALTLRSLLEQTSFAASQSETRPILTGVNFTFQADGTVKAVATDGLRLALMSVQGKPEGESQGTLTIPKAPLENLAAVLPKDDDEVVHLEIGALALAATWGDDETRFSMRGLEGAYPDASRLVPSTAATKLRLSRLSILKACERIAIFAGENENKQARFDFEDGKLRLSAASSVAGSAVDEVEILASFSENVSPMLFNIRYWLDTLRAFESEEVEVGLNGQNQPITIQPVDGSALGLISPLLMATKQAKVPETERQSA